MRTPKLQVSAVSVLGIGIVPIFPTFKFFPTFLNPIVLFRS